MTGTRFLVIATLWLSLLGAVIGSKGAAEWPRSNRFRVSLQTQSKRIVSELLQLNSLCDRGERIIFSCRVKRRGQNAPVKIASLCSSKDLDKEHGYLQYRYGLPGKVELEYPNSRSGTQQLFKYTHYMRYRVDLTEINFEIDGYQYQIFDDYNGEEKREISTQGVNVTAPNQGKEVSFVCRSNFKADFSLLDDVLEREE